jgi:Secretion system C-terminal sorting domain
MKKFLLTCFLAVAATSTAQNTVNSDIYNSFGYEGLMYGAYGGDSWKKAGGGTYDYQISADGIDNSDMCLQLMGRANNGAAHQLYRLVKDDWDLQESVGRYLFTVEFDIRNNTPANSPTLNFLQFEILHKEIDMYGVAKDVALYGIHINPVTGRIRAISGEGIINAYNYIGPSSVNGYIPTRGEWTHVRITYNVKTGYAEFKYGNKLLVETGNGVGDGASNPNLNFRDLPPANFVSLSPLKNKKPGLLRFINRSGERPATATTPALDNTAASDFSIDNLVVNASIAPIALGVDEVTKEAVGQKIYIDQEKTLVIDGHTSLNNIQVFDTNGKLVAMNEQNNHIALAYLNPGVYVVKYSDKKGTYSKRIIR